MVSSNIFIDDAKQWCRVVFVLYAIELFTSHLDS